MSKPIISSIYQTLRGMKRPPLTPKLERKAQLRRQKLHEVTEISPLEVKIYRRHVSAENARRLNEACSYQPEKARYLRYINSPEWKVFRMTILIKRGNKCEVCGRYLKAPQIHHLTYERLGKELETDVVITCDDCHRQYHGK